MNARMTIGGMQIQAKEAGSMSPAIIPLQDVTFQSKRKRHGALLLIHLLLWHGAMLRPGQPPTGVKNKIPVTLIQRRS